MLIRSGKRHGTLAVVAALYVAGLTLACSAPSVSPGSIDGQGGATAEPATPRPASNVAPGEPASAAGYGDAVVRDVERVRAATASFNDLDDAIAAGYPRDGGRCLDNLPTGGMGYHHIHPGLMDATIEVERPEILVYERTTAGAYELRGVEYAVPLDAWTRDEPPIVMGQPLKRAPKLGIWYRHVWIWRENPDGLFADWNPSVKCH